MAGSGGGSSGWVPTTQVRGWYTRRLPLITPVPLPEVAPSGPVLIQRPLILRADRTVPGAVFLLRLPFPPAVQPRLFPPSVLRSDQWRAGQVYRSPLLAPHINIAGGVLPPWTVRSDFERAGLVYIVRPVLKAPPPGIAGGVLPAMIVRSDYERGGLIYQGKLPFPPSIGPRPLQPAVIRSDHWRAGQVYRSPLLAPHLNIAGGVLPPWSVRSDFERAGLVYIVRPILKAPPPSIAGGMLPPWTVRSDFERGGLVYSIRPPWSAAAPGLLGRVLPPLIVYGDFTRAALIYRMPALLIPLLPSDAGGSWYADYEGLVWLIDPQLLIWSANVPTTLTKHPSETRMYTMDFSALPELENANLASIVSMVAFPLTVGADNVTLFGQQIGANGKTAIIWISGGDANVFYKVVFTVTVAGGTTLEDSGLLEVVLP